MCRMAIYIKHLHNCFSAVRVHASSEPIDYKLFSGKCNNLKLINYKMELFINIHFATENS